MNTLVKNRGGGTPSLAAVLGDEGLRLFFPLGAIHAAAWPFLWVALYAFDLPFARSMPPTLWHAHEMIIGAFGAALIGFITTAVPEWTDSARLRGRPLFALAAVWVVSRGIGLVGADGLTPVAAVADLAWLGFLTGYVLHVSVRKRTKRLLGFAAFLAGLTGAEAALRYGFWSGDVVFSQRMAHLAGFVFLGLLGLALARITVPVTNKVLDPSETTSPFRPHPGRLHLAPGLVAVAVAGEIAGLSPPASGYLMIAAGAAFLDRIAESFVGRAVVRAEILSLIAINALAGAGL
ncbi:MAG: NnrS family protein, partial [Rhodospirillaceae bacterium]|nr:NnrS family protein [Rhodospirillaceae bacterium]